MKPAIIMKAYRFMKYRKDKEKMVKLYFNILSGYLSGKLSEYKTEVGFTLINGINMFPYPQLCRKQKDSIECEVCFDAQADMYYVLHNSKKLYFPKGKTTEWITKQYKQLVLEQKKGCPHKYWDSTNAPILGDIFIDVGAAEGICALDYVTICEKVILIESNDEWIEALEMTFSNYKDKVSIVNKLCSDHDDEEFITLDTIVKDIKGKNFVVKMDVEGAEVEVLRGANCLLERNTKFAVCTYHNINDATAISEIFKKFDYNIQFSDGVMLLPLDSDQEVPYFRKGVLRACKL